MDEDHVHWVIFRNWGPKIARAFKGEKWERKGTVSRILGQQYQLTANIESVQLMLLVLAHLHLMATYCDDSDRVTSNSIPQAHTIEEFPFFLLEK